MINLLQIYMEKIHKHKRKFKRKKHSLELTKDITRKKNIRNSFSTRINSKEKIKITHPKSVNVV